MLTKTKRFSDSLPDQELEIKDLETYLLETLEPVKPRQEFVQGLLGRLSSTTFPQAGKKNAIQVRVIAQNSSQPILLIMAGLVGSLILLVTGIKAALSLVAAIKSIRQRNLQPGSSTSFSHPA